jgi:hypothetical protein
MLMECRPECLGLHSSDRGVSGGCMMKDAYLHVSLVLPEATSPFYENDNAKGCAISFNHYSMQVFSLYFLLQASVPISLLSVISMVAPSRLFAVSKFGITSDTQPAKLPLATVPNAFSY